MIVVLLYYVIDALQYQSGERKGLSGQIDERVWPAMSYTLIYLAIFSAILRKNAGCVRSSWPISVFLTKSTTYQITTDVFQRRRLERRLERAITRSSQVFYVSLTLSERKGIITEFTQSYR